MKIYRKIQQWIKHRRIRKPEDRSTNPWFYRTNPACLVLHSLSHSLVVLFCTISLVGIYITDYQLPIHTLLMYFLLKSLHFKLVRATVEKRTKFRLVSPKFIFPIIWFIVTKTGQFFRDVQIDKVSSGSFNFATIVLSVLCRCITSYLVVHYSRFLFPTRTTKLIKTNGKTVVCK